MLDVATTFRTWLKAATCLTGMGLTGMGLTGMGLTGMGLVAFPGAVLAQTTPAAPAAAPAAEAPPAGYWINGIHLSAQIQGGIIYNPSNPKLNTGQFFTERPNVPILNQVLLTAEKKLDPKATGFDWGFKLQGMYGSDSRYIHYLGVLDQALPKDQRYQLDLVEASASVHFNLPGTSGGLDLKAGLFVTPLGYELIDPATNAFYSHSYIFNYGLPFKHTGFLTTTHVTSLIDIYLGLDTGTNTTFGATGETNSALGGIVGFGLNMMDGNLTVLALSHIGPENPTRTLGNPAFFNPTFNANGYYRYYNDIVVTWKVNDKLTIAGEANLARDDFGASGYATGKPKPANAFGAAGYVSYAATDLITLNARAEVFRDDNGFFVAQFPGNYDVVNLQKGLPNTAIGVPAATYGAITLGVTFKPTIPGVTALVIRPEVRYDQSLGGNKVFNRKVSNGVSSFRDTGAFTAGADVVLTF